MKRAITLLIVGIALLGFTRAYAQEAAPQVDPNDRAALLEYMSNFVGSICKEVNAWNQNPGIVSALDVDQPLASQHLGGSVLESVAGQKSKSKGKSKSEGPSEIGSALNNDDVTKIDKLNHDLKGTICPKAIKHLEPLVWDFSTVSDNITDSHWDTLTDLFCDLEIRYQCTSSFGCGHRNTCLKKNGTDPLSLSARKRDRKILQWFNDMNVYLNEPTGINNILPAIMHEAGASPLGSGDSESEED
ncbi:MAG: hypothetical protein HY747_07835 [Elusimicrobia bacterium]|nr:hypothetical protein [Elusimicrobiota bacterium]